MGVPFESARVSPLCRSHSRKVLSQEPERARLPSPSTATALTESVCPSRVRRVSPVARSHSLSVLSSEPERARLPSPRTAPALTESVCPLSVQGLAARQIPQPQGVIL